MNRIPAPTDGTEQRLFRGNHLCQAGIYHLGMEIIVYSAPWCRDCREAKRFLERHNISYTEIDIESSPGAAAELIRHVGKRAIPQFVIDGEWVQPYRPGCGFLYQEMTERLGLVPKG